MSHLWLSFLSWLFPHSSSWITFQGSHRHPNPYLRVKSLLYSKISSQLNEEPSFRLPHLLPNFSPCLADLNLSLTWSQGSKGHGYVSSENLCGLPWAILTWLGSLRKSHCLRCCNIEDFKQIRVKLVGTFILGENSPWIVPRGAMVLQQVWGIQIRTFSSGC